MPADRLADWLETPESRAVGYRPLGAIESTGQAAGRLTVDQLGAPADQWSDADWAHAARTVGFIRRHRAQWPAGDVTDRRWRHSLRNWGHDPLLADRLRIPDLGRPADEDATHDDVCGAFELDGSPAGSLRVRRHDDAWEVVDLRVVPALRARGLGAAVLHAVVAAAARERLPVEAAVPAGDPVARSFLERYRFAVVGERGPALQLSTAPARGRIHR